jgi:hypothetical protein
MEIQLFHFPPRQLDNLMIVLDAARPKQLPHSQGDDPCGGIGYVSNAPAIEVVKVIV